MADKIIQTALKENRTVLNEVEAKALISKAGISVVETHLAATAEEAVAMAERAGFPVALKIVSFDILHKSDCGGVRLGIETGDQVEKAFNDIIANAKNANPRASILGVAVQKMADPGVEIIIGMSKDPQFGPAIMFGIGGVLVEVFKDVSFRIVPLTKRDAADMIKEIKGYPILTGVRGSRPVNISAIEDMILKLSAFIKNTPDIKELDLNPVIATQTGAVAVDVRILLEHEKSK